MEYEDQQKWIYTLIKQKGVPCPYHLLIFFLIHFKLYNWKTGMLQVAIVNRTSTFLILYQSLVCSTLCNPTMHGVNKDNNKNQHTLNKSR